MLLLKRKGVGGLLQLTWRKAAAPGRCSLRPQVLGNTTPPSPCPAPVWERSLGLRAAVLTHPNEQRKVEVITAGLLLQALRWCAGLLAGHKAWAASPWFLRQRSKAFLGLQKLMVQHRLQTRYQVLYHLRHGYSLQI